ncbi:hypothetical protein CBR_g57130 [Chara braunii]|uniref:Uncharacterized protein n=1 Tax=Chara braunii TaxID=69332 RepID=A0A388MDZ4_CHABU|nr:hypothetical protein CBR_g57130 [Chara braunii]|eukprot:GBG92780.1 hypothetical protein CBR_g57130 [Chara braunii]
MVTKTIPTAVSIESTQADQFEFRVGVVTGICVTALCVLIRMYARGRSGKANSRKGRWSNCGCYWMESGGFTSNQQPPHVAQYPGGNAASNPLPPGVPPGVSSQQQYATYTGVHVPPATFRPASFQPANMPLSYQVPQQAAWSAQQLLPVNTWQNGQWTAQGHPPGPAPAQVTATVPTPAPVFAGHPHGSNTHNGHGAGPSTAGGGGKGPAANNFPGPGNRAYFTKEYMEILEGIKIEKVLDQAKKKTGVQKRSGVRIVELPDEESRSETRPSEKSDDMKAWVTSTLGNSLKLTNEKLEEVDQKAKITTCERAELEQLRLEKQKAEKAEKESRESSSEKRKRNAARIPVENSPPAGRVKSRSCASSKTRPKRIDISDDEGVADVKQNVEPKMESSSELADIKQMLAALLQG